MMIENQVKDIYPLQVKQFYVLVTNKKGNQSV